MTGSWHDHLDWPFGPASLQIDAELEIAKITASLTAYLAQSKRRGVIVALSGGIDSSTVAALCVAALGKDRVFGLHMPERESSSETIMLSRLLAESLGIDSIHEDITPILEGAGCYRRRDDAIRMVCPDYGPGYKSKIVLPSVLDSDSFRLYSVVVMAPDGTQTRHRLTPESYLGIVAATNFKQRVAQDARVLPRGPAQLRRRGHAEPAGVRPGLLREAGRRLRGREADRPPLQVAGLPARRAPGRPRGDPVPSRPPPTPTPCRNHRRSSTSRCRIELMDLCLFGKNNGVPVEAIAAAAGLTAEQVQRVFRDIDQKRKTTQYLHLEPELAGVIPEISHSLGAGQP